MKLNLPQYEMRFSNEKSWVPISEDFALKSLFDNFDRVSPILAELFQGKEISLHDSIFRMRQT